MSSVLKTSTMKSPPLLVCDTGSFDGGMVSAAASFGPGTAALLRRCSMGEIGTLAAAGAASAAAPASVAPLRKLRRPESGGLLLLAIMSSQGLRRMLMAPHRSVCDAECCAALVARQDDGGCPSAGPASTTCS